MFGRFHAYLLPGASSKLFIFIIPLLTKVHVHACTLNEWFPVSAYFMEVTAFVDEGTQDFLPCKIASVLQHRTVNTLYMELDEWGGGAWGSQ